MNDRISLRHTASFLGGYALVFIAYDLKTNKEFALKVNITSQTSRASLLLLLLLLLSLQRLFAADDSAKKAIAQEIAFLVSRFVADHPRLMSCLLLAKIEWSSSHRSLHRCSIHSRSYVTKNRVSTRDRILFR